MVHGKRMFVLSGTLGNSHALKMSRVVVPRSLGVKKNGTCGKPEDVTSKAPPKYGGSPKGPPSDALTLEGLTSEVHGSADSPEGPPSNTLTAEILQSEEQAEIVTEDTSSLISKKRRKNFKPRGQNRCKKLASLKEGEKLEVSFYQNGPVGEHHHLFTSYMGMLIRDRFIVPIRVHGWNDIDDAVKDHLWASVSGKFKGKGFELNRYDTLCHMRKIWHTWRGYLVQKYVKPAETKEKALSKGPTYMSQADWEWLVSEHFFNPQVLKVRIRNSENRANLKMLHRTGAAPFRHIAYDQMGGKEGNDPTIAELFKKTREKKGGGFDEESASKLEEIIDTAKKNPGLTVFQEVEENFGPQDRGHMACFGYGLKPKHVRGELPSRRELEATIRNKDDECTSLRTRMDKLEEIVHTLLGREPQTNVANDANHVDHTDDVDNADNQTSENDRSHDHL